MDIQSYITSEEEEDEEEDEEEEEEEEDDDNGDISDDEYMTEDTDDDDGTLDEDDEDSIISTKLPGNYSTYETIEIPGNLPINIPQDICEDFSMFKEIFSLDTWNNVLTASQKANLKKFLPTFPANDAKEKDKTILKLFSGDNFKFRSNPLDSFFEQLNQGYFRPDIAKMRRLVNKAQIKQNRCWQKKYSQKTLKETLISRRKLLETVYNSSPDEKPTIEVQKVQKKSLIADRAKRKYFEELQKIRETLGENSQSSDDEFYFDGPRFKISKKTQKHLSSIELSFCQEVSVPIISTIKQNSSLLTTSPFKLESKVTNTFNPFELNEENYKLILARHKRRRSNKEDHQDLETSNITLVDLINRCKPGRKVASKSAKPKAKKLKVESGSTPNTPLSQEIYNSPTSTFLSEDSNSIVFSENEANEMLSAQSSPASILKRRNSSQMKMKNKDDIDENAVAVSNILPPPFMENINVEDDEAIDVVQPKLMGLFHSINQDPTIQIQIPTVVKSNLLETDTFLPSSKEEPKALSFSDIMQELELTQETHACYICLLKDIICSTPDQRMGLKALEQRLIAWRDSPISALNDWYKIVPNWVDMLASAINFLSGDSPVETQPEDFVPYLEYKSHVQAYQWIGAGRDSDHHLTSLCLHWLSKKDSVPAQPVRDEDQVEEKAILTIPPAKYVTTWKAKRSTGTELEDFHLQERKRYEMPHRSFTYHQHGYPSIVGPCKGVYGAPPSNVNKGRGHSLLRNERPICVTILNLVRDAVARLPNGEGTRNDICEMLRDSQYIVQTADDNTIQSIVGGALDRLHFETDTCAKYDTKTKKWVYLHRNRSEDDFERIHIQQQNLPSKKRPMATRRTPKSKTSQKEKSVQVLSTSLISSSQQIVTIPTTTGVSPTKPTAVAPVKASPVGTAVTRNFTAATNNLQNIQTVSTSAGMQTIQVPAGQTVLSGTSILTTSAGQTVKLASPLTKRTTISSGSTQQTPVRIIGSNNGGTVTVTTTTITKSSATTAVKSGGTLLIHSSPTTTASPTTSVVLQPVQTRTVNTTPNITKTILNAGQFLNVSQLQLLTAARTAQQQQRIQIQQQQKIQQKTNQILQQLEQNVKTTNLTANTVTTTTNVNTSPIPTATVAAKKRPVQQVQLIQQQHVDSPGKGLPTTVKLSPAAVKSLAGGAVTVHTSPTLVLKQNIGGVSPSGLVTTSTSMVSNTAQAQSQASIIRQALAQQQSLLVSSTSAAVTTTTTPTVLQTGNRTHNALVTTSSGKSMVAKVITNAQGQVISMESLLNQKQSIAGTVRVANAKTGQATSLIQIPTASGVPQYAMVTPGGVVGPRIIQTTQQLPTGQPATAQAKTLTQNIRMVSQSSTVTSGASLNMATIAGQPVILTKGQNALGGQNVFLTSGAGSPTVVLASSAVRTPQGGTLLLQSPGGSPQIVLPQGFQAGTLNLKNLQGIRVIPIAQTAVNANQPKGRPQVYARIITPSNRLPSNITAMATTTTPQPTATNIDDQTQPSNSNS